MGDLIWDLGEAEVRMFDMVSRLKEDIEELYEEMEILLNRDLLLGVEKSREEMKMDEWNKIKKYRGQWIAMANGNVLAFGKTLKECLEKSKNFHEKPIVFQGPTKEEELCIL